MEIEGLVILVILCSEGGMKELCTFHNYLSSRSVSA